MKIVFTGDLFLGGDLLNSDARNAVQSGIYASADYRIANLEQTLSDNGTESEKICLYTGSSAVSSLLQLKVDAVNLANNHLHDLGDEGIKNTLENLENAGIRSFGGGNSLLQAREPHWVDENFCILGYCDYGRPYLRNVQLANDNRPGVNPLRYKIIIEDLQKLPDNSKAILFFHWGREHVRLPSFSDVELANKLLDHSKVALIIGMHAHRAQGYIEKNGKRAYMCLGNFIFPNFFLVPPRRIVYPDSHPESGIYHISRQFPNVRKLTYNKWRLANRISLLVEYDTEFQSVRHIPVIQDDNQPLVYELQGISRRAVIFWIGLLSYIYKLPKRIYEPVEFINSKIAYALWSMGKIIFRYKEKLSWK